MNMELTRRAERIKAKKMKKVTSSVKDFQISIFLSSSFTYFAFQLFYCLRDLSSQHQSRKLVKLSPLFFFCEFLLIPTEACVTLYYMKQVVPKSSAFVFMTKVLYNSFLLKPYT